MMKKPDGESRTPTHQWAGLFFSKSMPDSEIRSKLSSSFVCQDPRMTTTYEVIMSFVFVESIYHVRGM